MSQHPHITDVDGTLHTNVGVGVTSTGVADPLSAFRVSEEEALAASNVVDTTVGGFGEDEEALRAGEEAAAAAMEGESLFE